MPSEAKRVVLVALSVSKSKKAATLATPVVFQDVKDVGSKNRASSETNGFEYLELRMTVMIACKGTINNTIFQGIEALLLRPGRTTMILPKGDRQVGEEYPENANAWCTVIDKIPVGSLGMSSSTAPWSSHLPSSISHRCLVLLGFFENSLCLFVSSYVYVP